MRIAMRIATAALLAVVLAGCAGVSTDAAINQVCGLTRATPLSNNPLGNSCESTLGRTLRQTGLMSVLDRFKGGSVLAATVHQNIADVLVRFANGQTGNVRLSKTNGGWQIPGP